MIIDNILTQTKIRIIHEKFVTDEKKTRYIDEIAKQIDRKLGKMILTNKIRKLIKSKTIKN